MIDQESIENLKNRLDIVDVVGSYLELKKSGANFKALCPFHGEDTPSFVVSPAKQIYHCFGCGAGGDSIKFVMEHEKLTYPETIEKLASQYNIHLKYSEQEKEHQKDKKILENLNLFFRKSLDHMDSAEKYLTDRGIYDSSIERFEIGYAPSSSQTLQFLRNSGVSLTEALDLGLVAKGDRDNVYSRFIERITFPIFSTNGKIVGFGGRTITNHPAKYINSPQSKIFDKSKLLYGYHKAKDTILREGKVIVTEGYLDVVMLHQAGFKNAVATLGTALTNMHIPILKRGNPNIILAYDGDKPGKAAAFKAAAMLSARGMYGGVVLFAEGVDPADMVKNHQIGQLNKLFLHPKPLIEFCFEQIVNKYNIHDPLQKEEALKEGISYLKTLSPILQDEYKSYFAALLSIDQKHVRVKKYYKKEMDIQTRNRKEDLAELSVIKTLLVNPSFLDSVLDTIDTKMFQTHKAEFDLLINNQIESSTLNAIKIRDDIKEYGEYELKNQLIFFLIKYYNNKLQKVKNIPDITLEKKSFLIRKIRGIIEKLKRGELVPHESFSTI